MSVLTVIKEVKEIHPESVVLVKIGKFYNAYFRDAYVIAYMFGYKLRDVEKDVKTAGFPESSYKKVIATLENKKIDYMVLDRRNNYDVDEQEEQGNLNKYNEVYNKAKKYFNIMARIENINKYLCDNVKEEKTLEIVRRMEEIIYEQRKV